MPPIFPSSTFVHGNQQGFDYTRSGNPNFRILSKVLASLEDCKYCTVFGSGVSAITAVVSQMRQGDLVLCEENLYGCTVRLFEQVFKKFGIQIEWVDFTQTDSLKTICDRKPVMVWLESPTNPLLKIIDLKAVCDIAKSQDIPVLVDNTFATPLVQQPLELGATLSLMSTTKYINGHSDALGGAICTNDYSWQNKMIFSQKALGLNPSPFDCWLITRGIKTLPLRLKHQIRNAAAIADQLSNFSTVNHVIYPHRKDHPQHEIAKKQMKSGGGIITVRFKANKSKIYSFCKKLRFFTMAESLGGIESLICHPSTMTHSALSTKDKEKLGIDDGLVRISVGCEDLVDLQADIEQALVILK